ncbi:MAG: ABC transporter substrate-binding protein [Armatimonadota bacterium]|nr:ABC transporter substrate-binding protein [Armatimonadota bacterium]MDR7486447.1 ABC transporter substrate-binding protein [Armatimonadota bacterium]MDR7532213.1 ABC transporter substrate-binding protein [Armatimonadota bacterium]MDR7537212.1 ABC transporter substrate-binding protein [Armatimonadota bacterium]
MKRRGVVALAVLTLLAATGPGGARVAAGPAEPILVGIPIPLTGPQATFGHILRNAYTMAEEDINRDGGVKGRPLKILIEDHQGQPQLAISSTEKLITRDRVLAIVGGYASATAFAMAPVAERNQVPYLIDVASADQITRQNLRWIFRVGTASSQFLSGIQDFMDKVAKPKTLAIAFENTLFGTDTANAIKRWADSRAVRIVNFETYEQAGVDFKPLLTKIKANQPDVLFLVSYLMDAALMILQARELNLTPKMIVGAGAGVELPEFRSKVGIAGEYVFSATLWSHDLKVPEVQAFVKRYRERYNADPTYHAAEGYAAMMVLADALRRASSLEKEEIWQALRATNLMTPFGRVTFADFDGYRNQNRTLTLVAQWQKAKLVTVWPPQLAGHRPIFPMPTWAER